MISQLHFWLYPPQFYVILCFLCYVCQHSFLKTSDLNFCANTDTVNTQATEHKSVLRLQDDIYAATIPPKEKQEQEKKNKRSQQTDANAYLILNTYYFLSKNRQAKINKSVK